MSDTKVRYYSKDVLTNKGKIFESAKDGLNSVIFSIFQLLSGADRLLPNRSPAPAQYPV